MPVRKGESRVQSGCKNSEMAQVGNNPMATWNVCDSNEQEIYIISLLLIWHLYAMDIL